MSFPFPPMTGKELDQWLRQRHPAIANAINWQQPGGAILPLAKWSPAQAHQLVEIANLILQGGSPNLSATPPLQSGGGTFLAPDVAWHYYVAYVAQSLAKDVPHHLPWSLAGYSQHALTQLLDSRSFLAWNGNFGGVYSPIAGAVTPGDPTRIAQFLTTNKMLGPTHSATILNLLEWCRLHLYHFTVSSTAPNPRTDNWQYDGWPPVELIISGTNQISDPASGKKHRTEGCHGTAGFLNTVLRTVNIPTEAVEVAIGSSVGSHAAFHFISDDTYLCHCDDPYWTDYTVATPPFPVSELRIDATTFKSLFGSQVAPETQGNNVFWQLVHVATQHVSDGLLRAFAMDLDPANAKLWSLFAGPNAVAHPGLATQADATITQADSPLVYELLCPPYTITDLQNMAVWSQARRKIQNTFGGHIDQIPAPIYGVL